MGYRTTKACVEDLERTGQLVRIKEEVDPYLEMAAIHLRVHAAKGPAVLFENIKGCQFPAVSNLYGTVERSKFIFRDTLDKIKMLIELKNDPVKALQHPFQYLRISGTALSALPKKVHSAAVLKNECNIEQLPMIQCWPKDGGAFVTLPLVYSEDMDHPGIRNSNLGMYRIQLNGNEYELNKEVGLHYQLHRGIGVHQSIATAKNQALKVSVFVGGPPALTLGAVMPLPEGMSELQFAGALANQRIRYTYFNGYGIAADADFVITGDVHPFENKPEGPFGDHLGYYSLKHNFPVLRVHRVFHRKDAIWPFTVVGRPPQEDTSFGALIHELTGDAIPGEINGLKEVHAVDAAGVHPLLLAIGRERYTPYSHGREPQEILTIANHILGKGQLSLAKYLFIAAAEDDPALSTHRVEAFLQHVLERVDWQRDLHFYTNTTIDTLDYSGTGLNRGSKLVVAAAGEVKRKLATETPSLDLSGAIRTICVVMPGIIAMQLNAYTDAASAEAELDRLSKQLEASGTNLAGFPLIVVCDDAEFAAASLTNFLWLSFTRSNPSHDVYGVGSFVEHKHWGCRGSLIIDARIKPHHAPALESDPAIEKRVDALAAKGGSLHGII